MKERVDRPAGRQTVRERQGWRESVSMENGVLEQTEDQKG